MNKISIIKDWEYELNNLIRLFNFIYHKSYYGKATKREKLDIKIDYIELRNTKNIKLSNFFILYII